MSYGSSEDSPEKAASDNTLRDEEFGTVSNLNYDEYRGKFVSLAYKVFAKSYKESAI